MNGQLTFDDCAPDWPTPDPPPRLRPAGTRYRPRLQNDFWGQRLHNRRSSSRIVTVPVREEYL